MIRFSETAKWRDPWFQDLSPNEKLVFIYVIENCDNAGFWEANMRAITNETGLDRITIEGALKGLERGLKGASGWYWVVNFLRHQRNERLNHDNPAHRQIIGMLERQSGRFPDSSKLLPNKAPSKGLPSPIGIGNSKRPSKSKSKSNEKVTENSPEMIQIGSWFGRKDSTLWTIAEADALARENPTQAQIDGMEAYYTTEDEATRKYLRRDLITLLNNWNGELDRARAYARK